MRYYKYDRDGYYAGFIVDNNKDVFYPRTTQIAPPEAKEGFLIKWTGSSWEYEEIPEPEPVPVPEPTEEEILEELRERRDAECFSVVDRGFLWYSHLTDQQMKELNEWYEAWLNVTETKKIPERPDWL